MSRVHTGNGMENPNIGLIYEALGAYQAGDQRRLRELIDPDIEVRGGNGLINVGTYKGFDGFMEWIGRWEEAWDPISYEPQDIVEVDDSLFVVAVHTMGRGAASGVEIDTVFGWVCQIEDGHATRFHIYVTVDEALDVARGLAEGRE